MNNKVARKRLRSEVQENDSIASQEFDSDDFKRPKMDPQTSKEKRPSSPVMSCHQDSIMSDNMETNIENQVAILLEEEERKLQKKSFGHSNPKVLIVYCGGTIGMVKREDGVYEVGNSFLKHVKTIPGLCDPLLTEENTEGYIVMPQVLGKNI